MSRVYDTPRYEDQTLNKILLHLDVASTQGVGKSHRERFGCERAGMKTFDSLKYELQQLELLTADEIKCYGPEEVEDVDLYLQYCLGDAVARSGTENLSRTVATGRMMSDIIDAHPGRAIWCDYDASIRVVEGYLSGKYLANISARDNVITRQADNLAMDAMVVAMVACRLGQEAIDRAKSGITPAGFANGYWGKMLAWNRAMELLRMKSMTPEAVSAHEKLRLNDPGVEYEEFSSMPTKAAKSAGCEAAYRVMGTYWLVYSDAIYVLDYSSLDQVHQVSKMWEGFYKYVSNYRISGTGDTARELTVGILDKCREWLVKTIRDTSYSDKIARCMKQSLALMQNDMHPEAERLNVNLEHKSRKLKGMIAEILVLDKYWHEFLNELSISYRARLDLAHIFYALPAPDCNVKNLFDRAAVYMQNANKANTYEFYDFMNYCMAVDFCKAVTMYRSEVTYECVEGYDPKQQGWYRACMKGNFQLPPDDEMGKVWVSKFFPFNNTLPQWYWEAADVTHVMADASLYEDLEKFADQPRHAHNELLYALEHAPKLSDKWDPSDTLDALGTGRDKWDRMAVMAVKCENTKPAQKCRETWSADDITRELTTCYDRAAIPIAHMFPGVTARKSDIAVQSIFDRICTMTRSDSKKKVIIMSNDVSGWSPLGDRDAWSQHHDYLIGMTKAPDNLKLKSIWKGIRAYLAKRGFMASADLPKGLFQGWTGTCDSIFNVHISLYCVRRAKRAGLLMQTEVANTAGLIDDAVQAVELDIDSTLDHQQAAADSHFRTTAETWKALGAELDTVKTIYSSSKFIYLNRYFCEGSEVLIPMKIFARADKEFNRRFASVFSQIDTVLGSYRASVEKGACPIAGYYFALHRSIQLAIYTNKKIAGMDAMAVLNAMFAPRGLGGWGFPHIVAWLTQEAQDPLSMYVTTMASFIGVLTDSVLSDKLNNFVHGTLEQEPRVVGVKGMLANPRSIQAKGVVCADSDIHAKIKRGMRSKCKSKVFRQALEAGESRDVCEALASVVRCCRWDAAILEILGQCIPSACSAALVDRAYKNELITQLFPYRVRSELSQIVKRSSAKAIIFLVEKARTFPQADTVVTRALAYDYAYNARERFYRANDIEVVNHTIPDYGTCLAKQYEGENPGITVTGTWPEGSCKSEYSQYRNMYDGTVSKDKPRTPRSVSAYTFTGERFRYMTPVQRCISKAAVVSAYLTASDAHGKLFWDIVMALWGARAQVTPPIVTTQVKPGTSTKRLSASQSHLTHAIGMFRNVHGCIEINADPIGTYLSKHSAHVDYMSMVTAARAIGLLNLALCRDWLSLPKLCYGFLEGSVPETDEDKLTVYDPEGADRALKELAAASDPELFNHVLESMVDVQYSRSEDEEYVCIGFKEEHMGTARIGREVSVAAGYISNIINCAVVSSAAVRKRTIMVSSAGDEVVARPSLKASYRLRRLTPLVPRTQALLCVAAETMVDLTAGSLRMEIAQAPWRLVAEEFMTCFPDWRSYWENIVSFLRRNTPCLDEGPCRALLGHVPHHVVTHLTTLDERADNSALVIVSTLYLAGYGRLRMSESYAVTSALGPAHAAKCWRLAARIRKEKSRKWHQRTTRERDLMGTVYQSVASAASAFHTREQVANAIFNGVSNHLRRSHPGWDHDMPIIDGRFTAEVPSANEYWARSLGVVRGYLKDLRYDSDWLSTQLTELAGDVYLLGHIQQVGSDTVKASLIKPDDTPMEIALPTLSDVLVGEEEGVAEAQEESDESADRTRKAAAAYLEMGIHFAREVYLGNEEYEPTCEALDEEVDEFLMALQDIEEVQGAGQMGDEV